MASSWIAYLVVIGLGIAGIVWALKRRKTMAKAALLNVGNDVSPLVKPAQNNTPQNPLA